jgi:hypothetical protein
MIFTFENAQKYYSFRFPLERISSHDRQKVRCPFHADRTPSMSLNLSDGTWYCHACKEGGSIYQFEFKMFPDKTPDQHWEEIGKICGLEPPSSNKQDRGPLIATHRYLFANGHLAFEKLRYAPASESGPKSFVTRMPKGRGWVYHLRDFQGEKPLYNLPNIVTANVVLIAEGEGKVDALNGIDWAKLTKPNGVIPRVAATCNHNGAGGWMDAYSIYMAGKKVFIFPDNDEVGRKHAEDVARSVARFAVSVHFIELPGLEEHGDVVDFLETHSQEDLVACIHSSRLFQEKQEEKLELPWLVPASLMVVNSGHMEWLVEGVVHAYSKGIFVAGAKAGKSLTALDMAVALALNQSWCGCRPLGRQLRCAVISREDPSFITQNRTFDFARGRGVVPGDLEDWLYFNTRDQSRSFYLENDSDCAMAIKWVKEKRIEFAIFDVLNLLHNANENSNTEMTAVMKRLSLIRDETNISLALIHHTPHSDPRRARGAGAIESWWEWKVVVQPDATDDAVKTMGFVSKACRPHPPITILIREELSGVRLVPSKTVGPKLVSANWYEKETYA